jgi:predicted nucleotidyltransferase component of viral defense system
MPDPIERMLNNGAQIAIARLEDSVVKAIYELDSGVVMHGGTAIWRCYGGYRFSSDVDIYLKDTQVKKFNSELTWKLSKYQLRHDPPSHDGRRIRVFNDNADTKIEAMKPPLGLKSTSVLYEMANSTKISIRTLDLDDFIKEKMNTYWKRFYARDFFDVYQLVINHTVGQDVKKEVLKFIETAPKPKDQNVLKDIVYVGPAPSFDEMVSAIRGRLK